MDPLTGKVVKEVAAKVVKEVAAKELVGEGLKTATLAEAAELPALAEVSEAAGWPMEGLRKAADATAAAFDGLDAVLGIPEIAEEHLEERELMSTVGAPLRVGRVGERLAAKATVEQLGGFWDDIFGPDLSTCEVYVHDWGPEQFNGIGDPLDAGECWRKQNGPASCAVVSQVGIIEYMTGECLSEDAACRIAEDMGWFDPHGGTMPEHCDKLLEYHGIDTDKHYNSDIMEIVEALENGDQVLVGLNANYLWYPMRDPVTGGVAVQPGGAGHAVWITGVDMDPHGNVTVLMNDSGHGAGRCQAVSLADFEAGWEEFSNFVVIAKNPQVA
ncbi:MAG TPA: hypothetical protein QGF58_12850 [Myxococcota bacterium]|nr:hypothetical protein [Myxococcota bacterium]